MMSILKTKLFWMNWTKDEVDYLMENFGKTDLYLIAWRVRRKESAVLCKRRDIIKKQKLNKKDD